MFSLFRHKAEHERDEEAQRQVDEIKNELFKNIENTTKQAKKVNKTLDRFANKEDITLNIYLATGGDRRK